MSSHPMRDFGRILTDARNALGPVDIFPATPQERAADKLLRKARARPSPPPSARLLMLAWFLFGIATGLIGALLALILRGLA